MMPSIPSPPASPLTAPLTQPPAMAGGAGARRAEPVTASRQADRKLPAGILHQAAWHAHRATDALQNACEAFWGVPVQTQLFSVSQNNLYFWKSDPFYVSQAGQHTQLRLSDAACASLLSQVLGERPMPHTPFSFEQLTAFEAGLLSGFSREVLTSLARPLIDVKSMNTPTQTPPSEMIHLVWLVMPAESEEWRAEKTGLVFMENREAGKIILSLPARHLKPIDWETFDTPTGPMQLADPALFHAHAEARIYIGNGRLPIIGLQQLEPGDTVVLEDSSVERLYLVEPERHGGIPFGVKLGDASRITLPLPEDNPLMSNTTGHHNPEQALWDNLMIEVGAEFQPTRMPLNQLKQMSEGLVVEIGDLIQNPVHLTVEGKRLATGDLVIVGDKFGIRISEVLAEQTPTPGAVTLLSPAEAHPETGLATTAQAAPAAVAASAAPQPEPEAPAAAVAQAPAAPAEEAPAPSKMDDFLGDDFDDDDDDW